MADGEDAQMTDEETLFLTQKRERKELQGADPRTHGEFFRRINQAQSAPFRLGSTFPPALQQMINLYSASFSCPEQGVLFPLLSACGACMGPSGVLTVTPGWTEPPILWVLVATPASPFVHNNQLIEHLQEKLLAVQDEFKFSKDFLLEYFDLAALHKTVMQNQGRALALFTSIDSLESIVNGSPFLEQMLPKLFNGGPWLMNTANLQGSLSKTCLGLVGQTDPKTLQRFFSMCTPFSRILKTAFLTIVTKDRQDSGNLLSAQTLLDLKNVFVPLNSIHASGEVKYRLSPDAQQLFVRFRNEYMKKSQSESSVLMKEILELAPRLLARLALLLHALETVLEASNWGLVPDLVTWNMEISSDTLWSARLLLDFSLIQKRTLIIPYKAAVNPPVNDADNKVGSSSEVVVLSNNLTPIKNQIEDQSSDDSRNSQAVPTIVSVTSAGITLEQQQQQDKLGRSACELLPAFNFPPSLSLSILPNAGQSEMAEHIEITPDLNPKGHCARQTDKTPHQMDRTPENVDLTACEEDVKNIIDIFPDTTPQKSYSDRTFVETISEPSTSSSDKLLKCIDRLNQAENSPEISSKVFTGRPVMPSQTNTTQEQASKSNIVKMSPPPYTDVALDYHFKGYTNKMQAVLQTDGSPELMSMSLSKNYMNRQLAEPIFDIDNITCKEFFAAYKSQVFKVLTMKTISITPSRAVQLKLFRDQPVSDIPHKPKYSCNYARKALTHLCLLGFGIINSNGTNGRIVAFQKKRYFELGPEQLEMMRELCVSQKDYEECFSYVPPSVDLPIRQNSYSVQSHNPHLIISADPAMVLNSGSPVQQAMIEGYVEVID